MGTAIKDPDEVLDWDVGFSRWLPEGDTIDTVEVTIGAGSTATVVQTQVSDQEVKVWLSGGAEGDDAEVRVKVTTANVPARVRVRCFRLQVREC